MHLNDVNFTNIGFWDLVVQKPTPAYQEMFDADRSYVLDNIPVDSIVLDVGCGTGRNIKTISERTKEITGIDMDARAVALLQNEYKEIPSINIVRANAVQLPFGSESFDVVTFLEIIGNLGDDKKQALSEAGRVLKKDGILILNAHSEDALEERLKMYEIVKIPIKSIEGGTVIFENVGFLTTSEQFSQEDIQGLVEGLGFVQVDYKKVGTIEHIFKFKKQ